MNDGLSCFSSGSGRRRGKNKRKGRASTAVSSAAGPSWLSVLAPVWEQDEEREGCRRSRI